MRKGKPQVHSPAEDAALWKNKYLKSLDELESIVKRWSRRSRLLRQGLVSVSGVADNDRQLDKHLGEMDTMLKRDDLPGLAGVIDHIERDARRVESDVKTKSASTRKLLAKVTELLAPLSPTRKVEKQLADVRSSLTAADAGKVLPDLTKRLVELLEQICADVEQDADLQQALKEDEPGLPDSKHSGGSSDSNEAASGDDSGSQVNPDPVVPEAVNAILLDLVEQLPLEEDAESKRERIALRTKSVMTQSELIPVLEEVADVVVTTVCRNREDFQEFLAVLVRRLSELQEILNSLRSGQEDQSRNQHDLKESVSLHLSELGSIVRDATDLDELKHTVEQQLDDLTVIVDKFQLDGEDEGKSLGFQLQELASSVVHMESEVVKSKRALTEQRRRALTDPLTLLPNREAYEQRLRAEEDHWVKNGGHLALAVGDIDHFKRINDNYGHPSGDKVLRVISKDIFSRLRETDFVARYGGEEFVLLMPGTSAAEASALLDEIRLELQQCPFKFKGKPIQVTMSFGISEFNSGDHSAAVFKRADSALYRAKGNGRNQCQQFESRYQG